MVIRIFLITFPGNSQPEIVSRLQLSPLIQNSPPFVTNTTHNKQGVGFSYGKNNPWPSQSSLDKLNSTPFTGQVSCLHDADSHRFGRSPNGA